jgi:hypothetical protein
MGNLKRELQKADVNDVVLEWFVSVRANSRHMFSPLAQEYAREVAEKLGKTKFKACNGWLESFRKIRHVVFN